jgi:hypothetical protein
MCRSRTEFATRLIAAGAAIAALGTSLGGCSDIYFDRRDTIALGAGDAIAANEAQQVVDPWPPYSGNPNVTFNGQRMQAAIERYRQGKVVQAADSQAAVTNSSAQAVTQISIGGNSAPSTSTAAPAGDPGATATTTGQ